MNADIMYPTAENWPEWVRHRAIGRFEWKEAADGTFFKERTYHRCDNLAPDEVETDGVGNITKMPQVRTKPCFGDVITYVMDGRPPLQGKWPPYTKCRACKVREACGSVSMERVQADAGIAAAYAKVRSQANIMARRSLHFTSLVRAVIARGPYASVNDDFMSRIHGKASTSSSGISLPYGS